MTTRSNYSLKLLLPKLFLSGVQKIFATFFGLVTVFLLATILGPDDFGRYSFALSLATVAALPLSLGLPSLVVREVARAKNRGNWGRFNGITHFAFLATLSGSLLVLVLGMFLAELMNAWGKLTPLLLVALLCMPLMALSSVRAAILTGLGLVVRGQIPDSIVRPISLIVMILCFIWFSTLTPLIAMMLNFIAILLSFLVGLLILAEAKKSLPIQCEKEVDHVNWLLSLIPLALVTGLQVLNSQVDILVLGLYEPYNSIGVYRVAASAAVQITFVTFVMNQVLAPEFVHLHGLQQFAAMRQLAAKAGFLCFGVALTVVSLYWIFGEFFIQFFLGSEYLASYDVLRILSIGYLVYALSSPVNTLLTMTGNERYLAISAALAVILNIALNVLLIPIYGVIGAAGATVIAMVVWRLILIVLVRHQFQNL